MTEIVAETRVNPADYQWWQDALSGKFGRRYDGEPQSGYYRVRRKGKTVDSPVAYWKDTVTGEQRCFMDGANYDLQRALEIWPHASKNPVTVEDYGFRVREGRWPNDSEVLIGHNQAPADDTPEGIKERLDELVREAKRMIEAGATDDKNVVDQASDIADKLGKLENNTITLHKIEKAPILEAGREVDAKWFSLRDLAAEFKTRLKAVVVTPFLKKQDAIIAEQNRKAAEAAAAAAEEAKAAAIASGVDPATVQVDVTPVVLRNTAGSNGRRTALRTVTSAKVTDWVALLTHLQDNEKVREAAQKVADASAKAGTALPGCEIFKDQRAA